MHVRAIGVAFAAVLAMACRTSGSQAEASGTAQAPPAADQGATGTAQAPPAADQGASGTAQAPPDAHHGAQGTSGGQDPLVEPGPAIKGHASDQVVFGKIEGVSASSVTISSDLGDRKVLEIAPETSITIDGVDASASELEEGQPVRASYNQAEGEDVAVAIEAGKESPSTEPGEMGEPGSSSPGESSSGTGSSGSASEPESPPGSSGR